MLTKKLNTVYKKLKLVHINFFIILFISLSNLKFINNQNKIREINCIRELDGRIGPNIEQNTCELNPSIYNQECFNYILKFNQKDYLLNSIASNKNEDFLIQYNEYMNYDELFPFRFFYGETNSRKYFFNNKSSFSSEFNIEINEDILEDVYFSNIYGIEDSKTLFISIKDDINKKNQYLFSINAYDSLVELYDLNNSKFHIWSFIKFFKLDENDYVFPFKYEIFEIKGLSEYIITFIPEVEVKKEMLNASFIKKFKFNSFDDNAYKELGSVNYEKYCQTRIMNVFFMDNTKTITVITLRRKFESEEAPECPSYFDYNNYDYAEYRLTLRFYSQNLNYLPYFEEINIESVLVCYISEYYDQGGEGGSLFIKSIHITMSNKPYAFFIYNLERYFYFDLIGINILDYINGKKMVNENEEGLDQEIFDFDSRESSNDLIQIDDNKVVFIYTSHITNSFIHGLGIIIVDIFFDEDYSDPIECEFYSKYFYIFFENYSPTRIKALNYNGFILFSSSGMINTQDSFYNKENFNSYLSMFMVFGYANGTDTIIDISKFLFKDNNRIENNFFTFLYKNFTIENNFFGYQPFNLIKLVSVPKEITIYEYNLQTHIKTLLEDSLMISGCIDYTIKMKI